MEHNLKNPEVEKIIILSTAHMTKNDGMLMGNMDITESSIFHNMYGHVVPLPSAEALKEGIEKSYWNEGISDIFFATLLNLAQHGYRYACFDCDGAVYSDLPSFDW